mgnify:CR=1 FL=1
MKNGLIVGIVLIVIILIAGFVVYNRSNSGYTINLNQTVAEEYPAVNSYHNSELDDWTNMTIRDKFFYFDSEEEVFMCDGKEVEPILYENSYPNDERVDGGWIYIYVIDCDDFYVIYTFGSAGPRLYGPFDFS